MGWHYIPTDEKDYDRQMADLDGQLKDLQANQITVLFMIGTGHRAQPLGRGRPHLDDQAVMLGGKEDLAWLPEKDDDFQKWVAKVAGTYGWPKGPITCFSLWNEPWEGLSISGWGADMIRYRELFTRMALGVEAARKDAAVQVLLGGCDSSTNTWDKLFGDGNMDMLKWLDVCTIHYQGLQAPSTYPEWVNRKSPNGRVRIWDTESWTANTDDRLAAVVATNRACGYDRAMGVYGGNVSSDLREQEWAYGEDGKRQRVPVVHAWSVAASVGAVQHFIGERPFREILFKKGLPWAFVFEGEADEAGRTKADDGTVVIVGDIGEAFGATNVLFRTVRGLAEVATKEELRRKLAALPATRLSSSKSGAKEREALEAKLDAYEVLRGASLTLDASAGRFSLYDFYGNPVPARDGKISVPLNHQGFFLRPDGSAGSFEAMIEAIRKGRIEGYEPLETVAMDMLAPVESHPTLRLQLTNILNRPIRGKLELTLGNLALEYPRELSFEPHEMKLIETKVTGGQAAPDNTYPLALAFDAGPDGRAVHHEDMHANVIARRTIEVDGKLEDWKGVLPQTVRGEGEAVSLTEAAWFPFAKYDASVKRGFATGFLAYDDKSFYFAAKVADDTPHPGAVRFETRDDDAYFYPEVSYELDRDNTFLREKEAWNVEVRKPHALVKPGGKTDRSFTAWTSSAGAFALDLSLPAGVKIDVPKKLERKEYRWPAGVRRFSYRTWPDLPAGNFRPQFDNVQIAFNAIPLGEDGQLPNPPGTMPRFTGYKCTDYEYALNAVAQRYGGGTEIWRMLVPGMPRKHFYPHQPKSPFDGPVKSGRLAIRHEGNTRIVECAIPWTELPDVKNRLDAGQTVKLSFRVNDDQARGCMELARERSVSKRNSAAFHVDWTEHWANEVEFAFEGAGRATGSTTAAPVSPVASAPSASSAAPAAEKPDAFLVENGELVVRGGRGHLFYAGTVCNHDFRNFQFQAEVLTKPAANSGVFFHTEFQKEGWLAKGYEAQINNSHSDRRRTGGLYAVQDVMDNSPAKDGEWFRYDISVQGRRIVLKINGKTTVDYTEPENLQRKDRPGRKLSHGAFALQAHDPTCEVRFRNIRVRLLP